jgi:hypothetical protein
MYDQNTGLLTVNYVRVAIIVRLYGFCTFFEARPLLFPYIDGIPIEQGVVHLVGIEVPATNRRITRVTRRATVILNAK